MRELKASGQSDIQVLGLAAGGSQLDLLAQQVAEFSPRAVAVACTSAAAKLPDLLKHYGVDEQPLQIFNGPDAAAELVRSLAMGQEGTVLNGHYWFGWFGRHFSYFGRRRPPGTG